MTQQVSNEQGIWIFGEYSISRSDIAAFLETDIPISWQDTMNGNILAQTFKWKYKRDRSPYIWPSLPLPSQYGREWHGIPEHGWPRQLLHALIEKEKANGPYERLTREQVRQQLSFDI